MNDLSSSSVSRTPARRLAARRHVPGFEILGELGHGRTATVYEASRAGSVDVVAIKICRRRLSWSERRLESYRERAGRIASIADDHICRTIDCGRTERSTWFAMQLVDGESLADRIAWAKGRIAGGRPCHFLDLGAGEKRTREKPRVGVDHRARRESLAKLVALFERTAWALAAGHEAGIAHGDLRPKNLMIRSDGEPVLMDWALAPGRRDEVSGLTRDLFGDSRYLSPEQLGADPVSPSKRADLWAFAVMFYEAIALDVPHKAATRTRLYEAIRRKSAPPLHKVVPSLPRSLSALVARALSLDADRRPATARRLAEEIAEVRMKLTTGGQKPRSLFRFPWSR